MNVTEWDHEHLWHFRAMTLRVLDGDTALLLADTGYGGRYEVHLRIAGLNAPEMSTPEGMPARLRLANALPLWAAGSGWPLRVISLQRETVVSEVRSFERFVGTILVLQADGRLIDVKELVA